MPAKGGESNISHFQGCDDTLMIQKWIMDLKVSHKTIKFKKINIGENLWYLGIDKEFLDFISNEQFIKRKINTLEYQIKNLCFGKHFVKKDERTSYTLQTAYIWQKPSI